MDTPHQLPADSARCAHPRFHRQWSSSAVLMLVAFDFVAFAAAVWHAISVPEALETAAASANASVRVFAGPTP